MSDSGKAVFISYASQDAEAAKRIAGALRAAGVEVWFDQNELVGGDQWDQKIRKQIRECALLIPVISKTTQGRREAYFRLEWKLADERTHLMAKGTPFILPVTIDATSDRDALVPDSFLAVQWTKLPGGEGGSTFATRVQKLLGGSEMEAARPLPAERGEVASLPRGPRLGPWLALGGVAVVVLGLSIARPWQHSGPRPAASTEKPVAPLSEARKLANQAMQLLEDPNFTRETSWLADELCQRALALDAADAEVWAVASFASQNLFLNTYDTSASRREKARSQAERASQLDPSSVRAALAVARSLEGTGSDAEVLRMLRELHRRAPDDQQVIFSLLRAEGRQLDEAAVQGLLAKLRALPRTGLLPLALWFEELRLRTAGRYAEAEAILDEMLAGPEVLRGAYYEKLNLLMRSWHELTEAGRFIDKIPARFRQEPSFGSAIAYYWLWRAEPEKALQSLALVAQDYFEEYAAREPKGYLTGWAHAAAGRPAAAQAEWRNALAVVEERLKSDGRNFTLLNQRALLLALTGQREAAREAWQLRVELGGSQNIPGFEAESQVFLALNEPEAAIKALEHDWARLSPGSRCWRLPNLRHHPAFAAVRGDPRVQRILSEGTAMLQELKTQQTGAIKPDLPAPADDKSVAVLAFANLSDDKNNEYFSDGISEELLNVLAKVPGLKVSARTSAFYFKGKEVPVPEIAKQLGVAYVVEGSVRKAGDKVRITAQLIKAADGFHVWSDTFTRDLKDVFAVQDEIAGLIAKNLELKLGQAVGVTVAGAMDPEAFRLYLQGREAWNRRDTAGFRQAELLFHRALELEPRFARAHAALADVWLLGAVEPMGGYAQRQSPLLMRAIAKAEQAVAMDEKSAEAHASLGHVLGYAWRSADARRALQRAIELNPNYASAHQWLGRVHLEQGELEEGIAMLRRAMELDPLSHRILDNYADALECAGRLEEAWVMLGRAATLQPSGVQIRCKQALLLRRLGRRDEALAAARALAADTAADDPDYRLSTAVAVLSACGETAEAEAALRRIAQDSEDYPVALLNIGRTREFIALLDNASINWIHNLWFYPEFAAVRAEAGLRAWAGKVGMAEALARAESWLAAHPARHPEAKR